MPYMRQRLGKQWQIGGNQWVGQRRRLPHHGANHQRITIITNGRQAVDMRNINHQ